MSEIQGHKSNEIGPLDRLKDEYTSFIINLDSDRANTETGTESYRLKRTVVAKKKARE